jgi:uncharacterized protein YbaP (TraB family)
MELDMDDRDLAAIPALVAELGAIRGSQTLADLIGTDNYATVRRLAGELEIPTRLFEKSEPWLAAISTEVTLLMRAGFDPEKGIEQHFSDMAVADGKRIDGLETERQQLELLDRLTMQAQTTLLLQSMAEGAKLEATLDDLIHAWRNGDNGYLERTLLRDLHASRELYETLVVNRNRRWALQINALLDDGADYLVIVGALHLVGKHGLPVLLAADGWSVRQLAEPGAVKPAAADRP